jgi:hypothetical protein
MTEPKPTYDAGGEPPDAKTVLERLTAAIHARAGNSELLLAAWMVIRSSQARVEAAEGLGRINALREVVMGLESEVMARVTMYETRDAIPYSAMLNTVQALLDDTLEAALAAGESHE